MLRAFVQARSFRAARRLALYRSVGSELDTAALIRACLTRGKYVVLPRVRPGHGVHLDWVRLRPNSRWRRNRYGIPEPLPQRPGDRACARDLDLVLLPLVGFDARGQRLGSGAGYYDRAFAFRLRRQTWRRPRLIGLAFACQESAPLEARSWDVPLDGVLTEHGLRWFHESTR